MGRLSGMSTLAGSTITTPDQSLRHILASEALAQIPKILTLQDRNPHSPTYGCFDRNFWHYKIIDFPSGMAQEFVWPLALAYALDCPDNRFYQAPRIKEWVEAGIRFAARSAHFDGSCDDYFPFEKAAGAAAFSLLACMEAYRLLSLDAPDLLDFFARRSDWLADHQESGRLSNHQALIALCLHVAGQLLSTTRWDDAKARRIAQVLSWQSEEGWFQEYEGCDPGYHTLTISCLARLYQSQPSPELQSALTKAVRLATLFMHPDGSYGGEYTSRNTYNYFPHGFELVGRWLPEALALNTHFLKGLANGRGACYADDHILGHHAWNYLLAWQDYQADRPSDNSLPQGRFHLKEAGLLIDRQEGCALFLALNKGGAFKFFKNGQLVASDTQFSFQVRQGGKLRNAVAHLVDRYAVDIADDVFTIQGQFGWAKQKQMTPLNLMILRVVMLTLGRFNPDLIRRLLQKMLITGKQSAPFGFVRQITLRDDQLVVRDTLTAENWDTVESAAIGCDQTSIYVVMSRTFQQGQLQPWVDLTAQVRQLRQGEPLVVERAY